MKIGSRATVWWVVLGQNNPLSGNGAFHGRSREPQDVQSPRFPTEKRRISERQLDRRGLPSYLAQLWKGPTIPASLIIYVVKATSTMSLSRPLGQLHCPTCSL